MRHYCKLSIVKTKDGKWRGILPYRIDDEKKRHQVTKVSKQKLKRDAEPELQAWAAEILRLEESHPVARNNELTVQEVVTSFLDEQLRRSFLEKSTYTMQISNCRAHIFPILGDYSFGSVSNKIIDDWLSQLAAKGLSQSTIHGIYSILCKTYNHYFFMGDIKHNPFDHIRKPKKGKDRITFLDPDQVDNLIDKLNNEYPDGHPIWIAVNLALVTGMRRGEICGLRWRDINFEKGTITVETAIGITKGGTYTKEPKNQTSKREFFAPKQLLPLLEIRKKAVEDEYGTFDKSWFVIGNAVKYMSPTTLSNEIRRFVSKYGLVDHFGKEVTLHSLRHNAATFYVSNNIDIASAAKMLGHTKTVMLGTYASENPTAMKAAADNIGKALSRTQPAYELYDEEE